MPDEAVVHSGREAMFHPSLHFRRRILRTKLVLEGEEADWFSGRIRKWDDLWTKVKAHDSRHDLFQGVACFLCDETLDRDGTLWGYRRLREVLFPRP